MRLSVFTAVLISSAGALSSSAPATLASGSHPTTPEELIPAAVEVYNELATDPLPFLSRRQIDSLLEGEVVRIRERTPAQASEGDRPERAVGYVLARMPRTPVWLAALDPGFRTTDMLTEVRLEQDALGNSLWYQHLSLPWPITDRHWVIRLWKQIDLCEATRGLIWEQRWDLADDGPAIAMRTVAGGGAGNLTPDSVANAIYLPHNQGGWTLFALDRDLTLLAYRVSTVVGGSIPDSWIATFAMGQLTGLLEGVVRHAADVGDTYDSAVAPIYDGAGRLIENLELR